MDSLTSIPGLRTIAPQHSLQERTYEAVRRAILSGDLRPGERLFEAALAHRLGVSRSPVREAVRRLQQDGLIEVRPRNGMYVAGISAMEIEDIYRIRAALEGTAAALAAERMSHRQLQELRRVLDRMQEAREGRREDPTIIAADRFHELIHNAAGSPRLTSMLGQIHGQILHFRNISLRLPGRAEEAAHGHEDVLEALLERDAANAESRMRRHVDAARECLLAHFGALSAGGVETA